VGAALLVALVALAGCVGQTGDEESSVQSREVETNASLACPDPCGDDVENPKRWAFEPSAAANPNESGHLVAASTERWFDDQQTARRWFKIHVSHDAGDTWDTHRLFNTTDLGQEHPLFGCNYLFDPVVSVTPSGTVLVNGIATATPPGDATGLVKTGGSVFVARSLDGGQTFPEVSIVDSPQDRDTPCPEGSSPTVDRTGDRPAASRGDRDKPWIASGPNGTVLVSWVQVGEPLDVLASVSQDGGQTFSQPVIVDQGTQVPGRDAPNSPAPAVAENGALYLAWTQSNGAPAELTVATSSDGLNWTPIHQTTTNATGIVLPHLATSDTHERSRLFLAYAREANETRVPALDVLEPGTGELVNRSVTDRDAANGERKTTLAVDDKGTAYLGFYHPREDGEEGDQNTYRVAAWENGTMYGPVETSRDPIGDTSTLGHYMDIAGLDDGAYPVWISGSDRDTAVRGAFVTVQNRTSR
jgi:hypothetical protein